MSPGGFETRSLPENPDEIAPDGSEVRRLARLAGGSMAHFSVPAGATTVAVCHRAVEEIWYFLSGRGEVWRKSDTGESVVTVAAGDGITIPAQTCFQLRALEGAALNAIAVTMPPWPGDQEATPVDGRWTPTIGRPSTPP
jgi:mannose-6-phosphate isomerase-like protein (cupin superfamily)